ncbi:MAG: glycosyltransferase family 4 protein [Planctomycetes bacterium]|nr:glycosyltransferase family 4 protein [Planctomycetota bacterium]
MNLHYISNARIPSERANTLQTMKMCEAFARAGAKVTLFHPYRVQPKAMKAITDVFAHFGVEKNSFTIRRLPALDLLPAAEKTGIGAAARGAFLLQTWTYTAIAVPLIAMMEKGVVFTREIFAAAALAPIRRARGLKVLYEAHTLPNTKLSPVLRSVDGVVCVSEGLGTQLREAGAKRVLVAPNGVDLARFENLPTRAEARARLGWDARPVAAYTGQLFAWKGVATLAAAAARLPGVRVLLIGGTGKELEDYRAKAKTCPNLEVAGQLPPAEIPLRLRAADVLVLPNTSQDKESREHTSPLKLFEYMASGTPVAASDLPSIREIATPENSRLFPPDDPVALAAAVTWLLEHPGEAADLAERAREDVQKRTWINRARAVLEFAKGRPLDGV